MDIQKDINKEVLKSDEEKVEDLAKDAEDLEKAVEKDIKDKVEKAEEVNDAKAEPIKSDIVASKKEFKDEQERDKEVVPGLEKAELEEGLTEAKKTLDDVYEDPSLESIWETKWKELVPASGKAKTPIGEVMRCFAKVSHEYFQNGSILGKGWNNKSNYDAANDMDRALQANGLNDNELCKLWDKIWATRSEAAYDHYLAEFYEKFINKYLKNSTVSEGLKEGPKNESVKPFTEKLELNEAAETQTEIKELLSDYLLQELEESEFMDNLAWRVEHDVPGYNHDWCAEEASPDYKEKEYEFIDELVEDLMANCPLEESLKESSSNKNWSLSKFRKVLDGKGKFDLGARDFSDGLGEIFYKYLGDDVDKYYDYEDMYKHLKKEGKKEIADFVHKHTIDESLKENKLNESDEEDLRKDANSLSDYLSKNKLYCDLEDYEMYPMGVKVVTFRVEGDWKHDHWYFEDLVRDWAKENGKEIFKMDEHTVEEDGSDYYTADHKVYITDKETSDRLNSMRGLFAPREESLKESAEKFIITKVGDDKYALAKGNPPVVNARIIITAKSPEEAKQILVNNGYSEDEFVIESLKESKKLNERISAQSNVLAFIKDAFDIDESDIKNALRDQFGCKQSFINYGNSNMWITAYTDKKNAAKLRGFALSRGADVKLQLSHNADQKNAALNEDLYEVTINFPMAHVALYAMSVCEESGLDFRDIQKTYDALVRFFYDLKTPVMGMDESLKEDLMRSSWGSNFQSDVYNALADIAFKYYRKDINITDDDWNDAIEWFMTHFFESDDNPFYESLEEAVSPDLINAIMWNYGCSKTEANKQAKGMSEERKKLLIQAFKDNAKKSFYSESLKESYFKLCGYTSGSAEDGIESDRFDTYAVVEASDKKDAYKQFTNIISEKEIKDKGLYITSATEQEYKEYLDDLDYLNNLPDAPLDESLKEDTAARHDLDILKPYLPSDFQYRQFYSVILVRKDIGTFMEALRKDGWKLISYPTATELETENNVFVGSAIFSKDNLNIYVWESESPKVCYVRLLDKSLDESKLDEAIPKEVAQALKNSSGLEIKNSGGAYYRIPGSKDSKYSNLDPKTALDNSKVDYANAEFRKISKEEAINVFKNEPQNLLLIVKDYGRNSDKAIWFDENGNRSGRVENVPLDVAPVRRDGEPIRDTKYMTPKQLIGCASACYWTNQREVLRDPDVEKERHQNPESKYYTGDSVEDVVKATSPKYRDSWGGIDNRSFRGVEMPSSYDWRPYSEKEYQRMKTDLNTWQTRLDSGELSPEDRRYALRKIDDLENKLKDLEKNRSKYYNGIKDYKANLRNLTMLKSKDYLKKLLDLRAKVRDSHYDLTRAERALATAREQGGTWSNDYDRRKVKDYESKIEQLKAQIEKYQKTIEELNTKLSSQQVSEEDAREIANAEAEVDRVRTEIENNRNALDAVLNRARARHQKNTESLEEDLKVTIDFASFEPWGRAEDAYNRIKDAGKLDEADAILEELYPEGISEDSLNAILAHEPEWLLNELGLADEEEVAMLDLDEE